MHEEVRSNLLFCRIHQQNARAVVDPFLAFILHLLCSPAVEHEVSSVCISGFGARSCGCVACFGSCALFLTSLCKDCFRLLMLCLR